MPVPEYPSEQIDRLIADYSKSDGTSGWTGPKIRIGIELLLFSRILGRWKAPQARVALEALAAAEEKLLYRCFTNDVVIAFVDGAYDGLMNLMLQCDTALGTVLVANHSWRNPCFLGSRRKMVHALEGIRLAWASTREWIMAQHRAGKRIGVHSQTFRSTHTQLLMGYAVFMTKTEYRAYETQLGRALERMAEMVNVSPPNPARLIES